MGKVIAFVPASGGVGASTLAAAVAVRAGATGRSTVAVDLDQVAGRLDVVFAVEQHPGWRWGHLDAVDGVVDGAALGLRLPSSHGVRVLAFDRSDDDGATSGASTRPTTALSSTAATADAAGLARASQSPGSLHPTAWLDAAASFGTVSDVVTGLSRSHDVTVLDLPRDRRALELVMGLVDAVVLVAGSRLSQVAAAAATMRTLGNVLGRSPNQPVDAEARTPNLGAGWSSPPAPTWLVLRGASVSEELADLVVDHLDLTLLGTVRDDRRLVSAIEQGGVPGARGRGSLVEVADEVLLSLVGLEQAA